MASVVAKLRDLMPMRPLAPGEALRIAEIQATRLLELTKTTEPPIPESAVASLPRIDVQRLSPIPVSGSAHWAKSRWVLVLNGAEPATRQRFSLCHEFKHVLDNPYIKYLYPPYMGQSSFRRGEQIADYFAACVLMPRPWMKRAWGNGLQDVGALADYFQVSQAAVQVRLMTLGLQQRAARCLSAA